MDAIALNYTSGTKRYPKGVVYDHRGAKCQCDFDNFRLGYGEYPGSSMDITTVPL